MELKKELKMEGEKDRGECRRKEGLDVGIIVVKVMRRKGRWLS